MATILSRHQWFNVDARDNENINDVAGDTKQWHLSLNLKESDVRTTHRDLCNVVLNLIVSPWVYTWCDLEFCTQLKIDVCFLCGIATVIIILTEIWSTIIIVEPRHHMMTSSNGNIFRVTGHLCGEFTGPRWVPAQKPVTRSFDVFFDLRPNKRLGKNGEAGDLRRHRGHYDVIVMRRTAPNGKLVFNIWNSTP